MELRMVLVLLLAGAAVADFPPADPTYRECDADDKAALLAIKASLGAPNEFWSWTPDHGCCDWSCVECSLTTNYVIGLYLFKDPNVTGTIPDAVAGLTHLETLFLYHLPALSGPIPPAVGTLSNLSSLTIAWTAVSGPVPSFLGALRKLSQLDLSFNSLAGAIPRSLGRLPFLSRLNLSRNRLAGAVPPLFLDKSLDQTYLWLSHNNLSGRIPAMFTSVNFSYLDLSRNALTGDASGLFGRGKELQYLDLSRNAFDFDLSRVAFPEQLDFVDLSHNAISGSIPAQVANVANLQTFNVSYNRLCGALPTGGEMATFDLHSFQHNKCLCGAPLPPCKK